MDDAPRVGFTDNVVAIPLVIRGPVRMWKDQKVDRSQEMTQRMCLPNGQSVNRRREGGSCSR